MKIRAKLLLLFMLFFTTSKAQNLIVNGSFETQINCCGYVDLAALLMIAWVVRPQNQQWKQKQKHSDFVYL